MRRRGSQAAAAWPRTVIEERCSMAARDQTLFFVFVFCFVVVVLC